MAEYEHTTYESRRLPLNSGEIDVITAHKTLWTSARCNRLLRPLSSKISLLRRERQFECHPDEQVHNATGTNAAGLKNFNGSTNGSEIIGQYTTSASSVELGGDWKASPRPCKRIKRTYSSKSKTCFSKDSGDEAINNLPESTRNDTVIELPPQLFEARQPDISSLNEACAQNLPQSFRDVCRTSTLPKDSVQTNWKLVDGICKAFAALLKATNIWKPTLTVGCRSLLSTCLRTVPRHIDEEEALLNVDDPDNDVDVSTMVYNDLEEYGSMPGGGWEPLRLLVRAHGVQLITDAIQEGLLGLPVAKHIYHICLDVLADDEAQSVIKSLISLDRRGQSPPLKYVGPTSPDLHTIVTKMDNLAFGHGRKGFLYRQTAAMLDNNTITSDWISSRPMVRAWNEVIQSITQGDKDAQAAALLLRTAVKASYKVAVAIPRDDVHEMRLRLHKASHRPILRSSKTDPISEGIISTQPKISTSSKLLHKISDCGILSTLSNVLTVLVAVTRLQGLSSKQTSIQSSTLTLTMLQQLALEASQAIELSQQSNWNRPLVEPYGDTLQLSLLAAGLAELPSVEHDHEFSSQDIPCLNALAKLTSSNEAFRGAGTFLCTVARYCGRANSCDPFHVIKALVDDLASISKSACASKTTQKLCNELALAAAFTYSEDTSRPHHLDWALQVEAKLVRKNVSTQRPVAVKTPVRSDKRSNDCFRWEEGICEWIVKTPALLLPKPNERTSEVSQLQDFSPAPSDVIKQKLPLLSDKAPSTIDTVKGDQQGLHERGGVKAETGNCGNASVSTELLSAKQSSTSEGLFEISPDDDDFDELSTQESSQEARSALSTLREPPNVAAGTKRKRCSRRQQNPKGPSKSFATASQLQPGRPKRGLEVTEVDELARVFKW